MSNSLQKTSELGFAQEELGFHAAAMRPNFLWLAELPTNWAFLDTRPEQWERRVEWILDNYYSRGRRLRPAERKKIKARLAETIQAAQDNKILLMFLLPGIAEGGELSACTLSVRWQSFSPQSASLKLLETAFSGRENLEKKKTSEGRPYLLFGGSTQVGPVTERRTVWSNQAVVPVTTTPWAMMVTGMAPDEQTSELVRGIVDRLVNSVKVFPDETGPLLKQRAVDANEIQVTQEKAVINVAAN